MKNWRSRTRYTILVKCYPSCMVKILVKLAKMICLSLLQFLGLLGRGCETFEYLSNTDLMNSVEVSPVLEQGSETCPTGYCKHFD